jgi:hypothetical protein
MWDKASGILPASKAALASFQSAMAALRPKRDQGTK